jgi:hypothetical protein
MPSAAFPPNGKAATSKTAKTAVVRISGAQEALSSGRFPWVKRALPSAVRFNQPAAISSHGWHKRLRRGAAEATTIVVRSE